MYGEICEDGLSKADEDDEEECILISLAYIYFMQARQQTFKIIFKLAARRESPRESDTRHWTLLPAPPQSCLTGEQTFDEE